jgi:NADPH-dependent 2,4-dienoyl-CoA reductase/sulfur reductase-like enzyme
VISGETAHFYSRTALMYIYMGHMQYAQTKPYEDHFWEKNRIDLFQGWVSRIDTKQKHVEMDGGEVFPYDKLILALGSATNKFGWPGQELPGVQGLYNYQDLQLLESNTAGIERAVIVGGGLIGVELAEMLHSRGIAVSFLVRESVFWGGVLPPPEGKLIEDHIRQHGIDLRMNEEMTEVIEGADGRAAGVKLKSGGTIDCQVVCLSAGVHPNIGLVTDNPAINTDRGILVNEFLETNAPDVYAIGDCAQFHTNPDPERRPIEQVWYTGRIMGEAVAKTITGGRSPYNPGHWFNSAKFFDIEYQTYGWVRAALPEGENECYWESADKQKALHFRWRAEDRVFTGVNTFGIRLRHEVFNDWLNRKASIDEVMEGLEKAHFDPEFYRRHYKEIHATYTSTANVLTP